MTFIGRLILSQNVYFSLFFGNLPKHYNTSFTRDTVRVNEGCDCCSNDMRISSNKNYVFNLSIFFQANIQNDR